MKILKILILLTVILNNNLVISNCNTFYGKEYRKRFFSFQYENYTGVGQTGKMNITQDRNIAEKAFNNQNTIQNEENNSNTNGLYFQYRIICENNLILNSQIVRPPTLQKIKKSKEISCQVEIRFWEEDLIVYYFSFFNPKCPYEIKQQLDSVQNCPGIPFVLNINPKTLQFEIFVSYENNYVSVSDINITDDGITVDLVEGNRIIYQEILNYPCRRELERIIKIVKGNTCSNLIFPISAYNPGQRSFSNGYIEFKIENKSSQNFKVIGVGMISIDGWEMPYVHFRIHEKLVIEINEPFKYLVEIATFNVEDDGFITYTIVQFWFSFSDELCIRILKQELGKHLPCDVNNIFYSAFAFEQLSGYELIKNFDDKGMGDFKEFPGQLILSNTEAKLFSIKGPRPIYDEIDYIFIHDYNTSDYSYSFDMHVQKYGKKVLLLIQLPNHICKERFDQYYIYEKSLCPVSSFYFYSLKQGRSYSPRGYISYITPGVFKFKLFDSLGTQIAEYLFFRFEIFKGDTYVLSIYPERKDFFFSFRSSKCAQKIRNALTYQQTCVDERIYFTLDESNNKSIYNSTDGFFIFLDNKNVSITLFNGKSIKTERKSIESLIFSESDSPDKTDTLLLKFKQKVSFFGNNINNYIRYRLRVSKSKECLELMEGIATRYANKDHIVPDYEVIEEVTEKGNKDHDEVAISNEIVQSAPGIIIHEPEESATDSETEVILEDVDNTGIENNEIIK
jgi:hypothetical protein